MSENNEVETSGGSGEEIAVTAAVDTEQSEAQAPLVETPIPAPAVAPEPEAVTPATSPLEMIQQGLGGEPTTVEQVAAPSEPVTAPAPQPEVPAPTPEPTPAPTPEQPAEEVEAEGAKAARLLAEQYRKLPGIVPDVIGGATVEEVQASLERAQASYKTLREAWQKEQAERVPSARAGSGAPTMPATPIGMIEAGLVAATYRGRRG